MNTTLNTLGPLVLYTLAATLGLGVFLQTWAALGKTLGWPALALASTAALAFACLQYTLGTPQNAMGWGCL